ncbi:MAG: 2Fe-2S iron-sulfur cluster-binding protein, partial [Brevinema sp.]
MNTESTIEMVSLTVNGKEYSAPKGIPLIEAVEMNGIKIPRLCYHPDFYKNGTRNSGACGLC